MPLYEFRCRICDQRFEVRRPMSETAKVATCPEGHEDTVRLLSSFATASAVAASSPAATGGCCGGACGCRN
jgi:putative FmdB family regulatory protein